MKHKFFLALAIILLLSPLAFAKASPTTQRIPQFTNEEVHVWKTVIYPGKQAKLVKHRHEHNRVLIALSDGTLKITNDQGQTHYLKLKKDYAYYLTKDKPQELHTDENISQHPIEVLVIELRK